MSIEDKAKLATWFYWFAMILLNLGWLVLFWDSFSNLFVNDEMVLPKHILSQIWDSGKGHILILYVVFCFFSEWGLSRLKRKYK